MPIWAPEDGGLKGPAGHSGEAGQPAWQPDSDLAACAILLTVWQIDRFFSAQIPLHMPGPFRPTVPASVSLKMYLLHGEEQ